MKYVYLFLFNFIIFSLHAQDQPVAQDNIINYEKLKYFNFEKEGLGKVTSKKAKEPKRIELKIETTVQPDFFFNLSTSIPLSKKKIKAGEILLLSFSAKTEYASLETGEARVLWMLNVSDEPKERIKNTMSISSEWKQYYLPIAIENAILPKHLRLAMQFGFPPQTFLIKDLKLEVFDENTSFSDLPKTKNTYPGMEADAEWRTAALQRIEENRKGDFELCFVKNGKLVKNQDIQIDLKKHDFGWGAAMNSGPMLQDEEQLKHFSKAFNLAVFENELKIKFWNRRNRKEDVLKVIDLLAEKNIDIKGHVLIWPGFRHLTPDFKKYKNEPEKITKLMEDHVDEILTRTKGLISRWDVANETYTNRDLQEITGSENILFHGFEELHKREKNVLRFTNEYGIISKGGIDKKKQQWYYDYIKRVDENTNGKVDGIGIQCHMGSDLTSPEKVLEILDFYATLNKKISISEFTMSVNDPELREQYTSDFMIAAFSHPSVSEFLFWAYKDLRADIYNPDWTLGSMGKAYFSLVHNEWKTNFVAKTDNKGKINNRGFYGTYEYTLVDGNKVIKGTFDFNPGQTKTIKVKL